MDGNIWTSIVVVAAVAVTVVVVAAAAVVVVIYLTTDHRHIVFRGLIRRLIDCIVGVLMIPHAFKRLSQYRSCHCSVCKVEH